LIFKKVLQGSAVTHLRCDRKCVVVYVANFIENTTVKNSENRPTFVTVFLTHCV